MFEDRIIDEIRRIRHQIEKECNHDDESYYTHLLEIQKKYADRLIRRKPNPALAQREKSANLSSV